MSYPILYSATETNFDHNGIGILSACVSCEVTEEANGMYELSMLYPMDGVHFHGISDRSIIKAKPDKFREPQLFRVYAIRKPMSGIVSVFAEHISYELCSIPVSPFSASNVFSALQGLKDNAVVDCPFDFWTDKSTEAEFATSVPASIRSRLGGSSGSILDIYAGEYEFDNYTVKLHNNRGMNRGVSIRYGKNLTNIQQDQNCSNVATGVYPYWAGNIDGSDIFVQLPEKIINAPGTYNFVKIKTIDFSKQFETQPSEEQLRTAAENYIKNNNIGVPDVSLTVSFEQLEQSDEYKGMKLLERVSLFDDVNVVFPDLGVSATAKAVKLVYDVIADRVKTVSLGSVRASIADTIVEQQKEIEKAPTITDLERAKSAATSWLTNGKGYKVERVDANGNTIDTLYMDTPDIETAVNIMRVGQSGIGFSHNGVNGPYNSAWTIDGKFVADFIASGTLYGLLFKAGMIESLDGDIKIDLTSGSRAVFNSGLQTNKDLVVMDVEDSFPLFKVESTNAGANKAFSMSGFDGAYNYVFNVGRVRDIADNIVGTQLSVIHEESYVDIEASREHPGIVMRGVIGSLDFGINENWGGAYLQLPNEVARVLSWRENADGTYTLVGR